jgi:hypothetical protein
VVLGKKSPKADTVSNLFVKILFYFKNRSPTLAYFKYFEISPGAMGNILRNAYGNTLEILEHDDNTFGTN